MERTEVIKALELHSQKVKPCLQDCPYGGLHYCGSEMAKDALTLINELTQSEDYWKRQAYNGCMDKGIMADKIKELTEENEILQYEIENGVVVCHDCHTKYADKIEQAKADTVRKMQTEIEARCIKGGIYPAFVKNVVNQVANELLEGNDGR